MIFATVGSHPTFGFERFLRALEAVPRDDLVVQHGPGTPPSNASTAVPWMRFAEVLDHLDRAEKVVSHAGSGTIILARRAGHIPVVMPRLRRFDETVDDHQLDLARHLAASGAIVLVEEAGDLAGALEGAPSRGEAQRPGSEQLVGAVREELLRAS